MIIYNDIFEKLRAAGISTNALRQAGLLSESTMTRIRKNEPITTDTLDVLCQLLHCTIDDLVTVRFNDYQPDLQAATQTGTTE